MRLTSPEVRAASNWLSARQTLILTINDNCALPRSTPCQCTERASLRPNVELSGRRQQAPRRRTYHWRWSGLLLEVRLSARLGLVCIARGGALYFGWMFAVVWRDPLRAASSWQATVWLPVMPKRDASLAGSAGAGAATDRYLGVVLCTLQSDWQVGCCTCAPTTPCGGHAAGCSQSAA